jgi:hypothetical protein
MLLLIPGATKVCVFVAVLQGRTAIMYATCYDSVSVIEAVLKAGADVNAKSDIVCTGVVRTLHG